MNQYTTILFSLAIIGFIFYNQVRVRQVKSDTKLTMPLIMLVLGIYTFKNYYVSNQFTAISWLSIIISFTALAVGMAAVRATTVKIWIEQGITYRQGTWITVLLWIVSIVLHVVLNMVGNVGQSTSLIYFAITFTVQKLIVQRRAEAI